MKFYKSIIKPLFFSQDPENAHNIAAGLSKTLSYIPASNQILRKLYCIESPKLEKEVFGLKFKNPVGLAAGFDKNATMVDLMENFGFGFVEIGTVTPLPQDGNPKPRLFRLPEDEAIINRMGFNNLGMVEAARRLRNSKTKLIIGGNIGKNKLTPNENAILDYEKCFNELYDTVDYFVLNVSSPNTPGLRALQEKEPLRALLQHIVTLNINKSLQKGLKKKPVLLKIAPDLSFFELDDILEIIFETKIDGIIATNTTISRSDLKTKQSEIDNIGMGGLSGKPLKNKSTEIIKYIATKTEGKLPIIGVGGIHSADDALEKLDAGASLIQLYSGFVYEGPSLITSINKALLSRMS